MKEIINVEVNKDSKILTIECLVNKKTQRYQMTFEALGWFLFKE